MSAPAKKKDMAKRKRNPRKPQRVRICPKVTVPARILVICDLGDWAAYRSEVERQHGLHRSSADFLLDCRGLEHRRIGAPHHMRGFHAVRVFAYGRMAMERRRWQEFENEISVQKTMCGATDCEFTS